jgi:anti-sigma factor RsiW
MREGVGEAELAAYVDGQLDTAGRIAVEAWLQNEPEAAARVLADLRLRDELRLYLAEETTPDPLSSIGLARELTRRLHRRSLGRHLRRAVAAAILIAVGWFAHAEFDLQVAVASSAPDYADEAAEAYAALSLKLATGLATDPQVRSLPLHDGGDLVRAPALAGDLRFLGSDLVPWDGGVALVTVYEAGPGRLVTLFTAESARFAVEPPRLATAHGLPTVFWQDGHVAHALNGGVPEAQLLDLARAAAAQPRASQTDHSPS